jgi:hypothetical protein
MNERGRVFYAFELLPNRKLMFFGRISGVSIGGTYACTKDSISKKPERIAREIESNPEWEANDALVDERNMELRNQVRIASLSRPHIKAAIQALKPLVEPFPEFDWGNSRKKIISLLVDEARKAISERKKRK